jgi:D-psicose/D-tagatose/L-ribulose 3-epimerase
MELQNFEKLDFEVKEKFQKFLKEKGKITDRIKLSWSNWGFGMEPLETSLKRLKKFNVKYIELHGNLYGSDIGYRAKEINKLLSDYNIEVSGLCGMVSSESELASNSPSVRQRCIDYFKRNIEFCSEVRGEYLLFGAAAVGRPNKYDNFEFERSVETMQIIADYFVQYGVKGAIEPIRSDEVSIVHTFEDALRYIKAINHKGVQHICGDVYHILHGERHMGETILKYGDYLVNLHMADTNRLALGSGMLNLDVVLMSLYLIGYNNKKAFCSAEPLGAGANPYIQMYGINDPEVLDKLVSDTASYFYRRENLLLLGE